MPHRLQCMHRLWTIQHGPSNGHRKIDANSTTRRISSHISAIRHRQAWIKSVTAWTHFKIWPPVIVIQRPFAKLPSGPRNHGRSRAGGYLISCVGLDDTWMGYGHTRTKKKRLFNIPMRCWAYHRSVAVAFVDYVSSEIHIRDIFFTKT